MSALSLTQHPSPNFNERRGGGKVRYVVVHYTGMATGAESLARLCDPVAEVSSHYLIEENGEVYQLVDEAKRAWHAGKSFWRCENDLNSLSVGIELVNPGHAFGYRPFPEAQIEALQLLLEEIVTRHQLCRKSFLLAHADVAPTRREDPGELFPWELLAEHGFGVWPSPLPDDHVPLTIEQAQMLLRTIGYEVAGGLWDEACDKALIAFQRHYNPDAVGEGLQIETCARLRAVARQLL